MKIFLTGANGFLGSNLARRLANDGHEVLAIVRRIEGQSELTHPNIKLVQGHFGDDKLLADTLQGVEVVFHLAAISTDWAPDLRDFYKVNVEGGLRLFAAAKAAGVRRIVVTSTAGTIGPPDPDAVVPAHEDQIRHVRFFTDYECSKIILEERIQQLVRQGMDIVVVNPTRIYGPGPIERKNAYLMVIHRYLYKAFSPYPAFKTQLSNMTYIDDVVEGHLLALARGRAGERYLLGGHNVTFTELFAAVGRVSGRRGRPLAIPVALFSFWAWVNRITTRITGKAPMVTREWIQKSTYSWPVSSEKAIRELGYAPTPFDEAIAKTVAYIDAEVKAGRVR